LGATFTNTINDTGSNPSAAQPITAASKPFVDRYVHGGTSYFSTVVAGGEAITQAPRYLWASFLNGPIPNNSGFASFIPDKAITITRIDINWQTLTATCTVAPTITISDGTNVITLTIANTSAQQAATFSQNYAAGVRLNLGTTAGTCTQTPSVTMIQAQYKMQ
jgi:hypothetical protein